jgi:hypothetical protein
LLISYSRFLQEVDQYSEENKMNYVNLGTIFGPHLLRPQTDDPHILMDSNSVSANFVRVLLVNLNELFPLTNDERAPKRLSVVFQPDVIPPWLKEPDTPKVAQRSLYQPKNRYISFRPRQNSAPPSHKGKCMFVTVRFSVVPHAVPVFSVSGKVASMVEQFNNLKGSKHTAEAATTRSVEITAPILDYQPGVEPHLTTIGPVRGRSHSPERRERQELNPVQNTWKNNPMFGSSEGETLQEEDDDDDDVPDIIKRLSQNGLAAGKQLSDTLSSDMIVNSISNGNAGCCFGMYVYT